MAARTLKNAYVVAILVGLFVLITIFWHSPVLYPVKVFTVILHELGHGLAAILTGGRMVRIEISPQIGGVCYTQGGLRLIVLSAGYLGSMLFGCLMMLIAARTDFDRHLSTFVGCALVVLVFVSIRSFFGVLFGLAFGVAMILDGPFCPKGRQ
ncbi:M50 family metallopeptidase [Thermodesulfobacteriota bacterium]